MISFRNYMGYAYKNTPQVYADKYYRLASYPLSYLLHILGFGPNAVTVAAIVTAFAAGVVFVLFGPILGTLTFMLSYLLDFCDGNIARVLNKLGVARPAALRYVGLALETLHANVLYFVFYAALSYYLYSVSGEVFFLYLGYLLFGSKMLIRYMRVHAARLYADLGRVDTVGVQTRYETSTATKIKFFFSKVLFTANLVFVIYLPIFIFWPEHAADFFIAFTLLEVLYNSVAIAYSIYQIGTIKDV